MGTGIRVLGKLGGGDCQCTLESIVFFGEGGTSIKLPRLVFEERLLIVEVESADISNSIFCLAAITTLGDRSGFGGEAWVIACGWLGLDGAATPIGGFGNGDRSLPIEEGMVGLGDLGLLGCSLLGDNGCSITLPKLMLEVRLFRRDNDD